VKIPDCACEKSGDIHFSDHSDVAERKSPDTQVENFSGH
jgi:hypothetical protein